MTVGTLYRLCDSIEEHPRESCSRTRCGDCARTELFLNVAESIIRVREELAAEGRLSA